MKSKVIDGIWHLEPETNGEEAAIRSMAEEYGRRGVSTIPASVPTSHSRLAAPDHNMAAAAK